MKKFNYILRSLFAIILLAVGVNTALAAETVTITAGTDFTATSATFLNGQIEMTTAQNKGTNAPAYNAGSTELRLYYGSNGNGCSVTFALEGIKITQIVIEASSTSYTPTVKYSVDEGALATAGTWNNKIMTISGIEASKSLMIQNANTSNKQLRIKKFTITYEPIITSEPTLRANPDELTFKANPGSTTDAQTITLTAANITSDVTFSCSNSAFDVEDNGDDTYDVTFTAPAVEGTYEGILTFSAGEVAVDVALTAVVKETVRYQLVTDASTLREGNQVIIVAKDYNFALSGQTNNNRGQVAITKDGDYIHIADEAVQVLTLQAGTIEGTFAFYTGSGYLYAASSSSNHLKTETTLSDNSSWAISIAASGVATIKAQGTNSRNWLKYNNSSSLFSCYESGQQDVSIYRRIYAEDIVSEKCYFLVLNDDWKTAAGNYYAKFINKNTNEHYALVEGVASEVVLENSDRLEAVEFYLSQYNIVRSGEMPVYTHVIYYKSKSGDLADASVVSEEVAMGGNNIYTLDGEISTGIESVEVAEGIRYAYGVVEAEGAIEVYNVNGTVVARGNDNVDLAGLNRGVYIVRNGNQVRKVVR